MSHRCLGALREGRGFVQNRLVAGTVSDQRESRLEKRSETKLDLLVGPTGALRDEKANHVRDVIVERSRAYDGCSDRFVVAAKVRRSLLVIAQPSQLLRASASARKKPGCSSPVD